MNVDGTQNIYIINSDDGDVDGNDDDIVVMMMTASRVMAMIMPACIKFSHIKCHTKNELSDFIN